MNSLIAAAGAPALMPLWLSEPAISVSTRTMRGLTL